MTDTLCNFQNHTEPLHSEAVPNLIQSGFVRELRAPSCCLSHCLVTTFKLEWSFHCVHAHPHLHAAAPLWIHGNYLVRKGCMS